MLMLGRLALEARNRAWPFGGAMRSKKKRTGHYCTCPICRTSPRGSTAKEHRAINRVLVSLDEKSRRRFAGLLALHWGRGGLERASQITGLSRPTIRRGRAELQRAESVTEQARLRRVGAGRRLVEKNTRPC